MFRSTRPLHLLRSVVCLSLLGVAVVALSGPALAVAGTVLPFALVGGLTWGAYRLCRALVRRVFARRTRPAVVDGPASPDPIPVACRAPKEARPGRFGSMLRAAVYVGVEVGCGAALGAALSVLADWQIGTGIEFPAFGLFIGAVVGFVVGGMRPTCAAEGSRDEEASSVQAA